METEGRAHEAISHAGAGSRALSTMGGACLAGGFQILLWTAVAVALNARFRVVLSGRLFWSQDLPVLFGTAFLLLVFAWVRGPSRTSWVGEWLSERPGWSAFCLLLVAAAVMAVTYALTGGFHFSGDEVMADFDARIFRSGHLIAKLAPAWRPFRTALVPNFLLPVPGGVGLVSSYLPGNAALRALVGLVVSPNWTSPLLAGVALLALFRIARRLWPDQPDAVVVAMLMLATSSQVLVTATTAYAMTAHMAVNLIWLWLFLRDDRIGHVGAMVFGFVGCGLHQLVFHPLFAAPFILELGFQRRWRLTAAYVAAYAAIGAFWIAWPGWVISGIAAPPDQTVIAAAPQFLSHVLALASRFSLGKNLLLLLDNLLRFIAWQHPLLLPLLLASLGVARRCEGIARPLLAGLILAILVPFLVMPWQGNGWGYRYLHGCLGSVSLLAGYGWLRITSRISPQDRKTALGIVGLSTAATVLLVMPAHLWQAHAQEAPFRRAEAAIRRSPSDVVIVDPVGIEFAGDLVRNGPFLRNKPKVLDLAYIDAKDLRYLCSHFSVSVFSQREANALGLPQSSVVFPKWQRALAQRRSLMRHIGCGGKVMVTDPHPIVLGNR